jgi:hypothetical protein
MRTVWICLAIALIIILSMFLISARIRDRQEGSLRAEIEKWGLLSETHRHAVISIQDEHDSLVTQMNNGILPDDTANQARIDALDDAWDKEYNKKFACQDNKCRAHLKLARFYIRWNRLTDARKEVAAMLAERRGAAANPDKLQTEGQRLSDWLEAH